MQKILLMIILLLQNIFEVSKKFENDAKHEKFKLDNIDYEYD